MDEGLTVLREEVFETLVLGVSRPANKL